MPLLKSLKCPLLVVFGASERAKQFDRGKNFSTKDIFFK